MAIYTNYGRFLKAKQFKDSLESAGDTYMVLGIGDPTWDNDRLSMPLASYDATSIRNPDSADTNQFFDDKVCQYILSNNYSKVLVDCGNIVGTDHWVYNYKKLLPPFPCLWKTTNSDEVVLTIDDVSIKKNEFHLYYIKTNNNSFSLYKQQDNTSIIVKDSFDYTTIKDDLSREYFAELYLRGLSVDKWLVVPGLLGAVRCKIEFAKDIGFDESRYTGSVNQLFYGDRYWEIIPDSDVSSYYDEYLLNHTIQSDEDVNYPTHLLITALINPGYLVNNLSIDQSLCARQIAIYTSNRSEELPGPMYYRSGEYLFNFGQYCKKQIGSEWKWVPRFGDEDSHTITDADDDKVLDFTVPFNIDNDRIYPLSKESKKFNFVLHDYILGNRRDKQSADRISYIVGF